MGAPSKVATRSCCDVLKKTSNVCWYETVSPGLIRASEIEVIGSLLTSNKLRRSTAASTESDVDLLGSRIAIFVVRSALAYSPKACSEKLTPSELTRFPSEARAQALKEC